MTLTPEELENAAADVEQWLDDLDPTEIEWNVPLELAKIAVARHDIAQAERGLTDAVVAARNAGQSWTAIGRMLGVSRQAAHERFGPATTAA